MDLNRQNAGKMDWCCCCKSKAWAEVGKEGREGESEGGKEENPKKDGSLRRGGGYIGCFRVLNCSPQFVLQQQQLITHHA